MPFVYLNADQLFLGTEEVILGDDPEPPGPVGFEVYRNGDLQDILWSRSQLLSISLGIAAYDGEIGTGSVTLPGLPDRDSGWWTGDRISFIDPISGKILYTGYLTTAVVSLNPDALTELQTTWSLADMNRQLIGHSITDLTEIGPFAINVITGHIVDMIEGAGPPKPTVDTTWADTDAGVFFPTTTWNSDGAIDMINQIIQYTAWTVYIGLTDTENVLALHVHDLLGGPSSDINIDATAGVAGGDTFAPALNSTVTYDASDLKDGVTGRNGVTTVGGIAVGTYADGGLSWEATLEYGSLSNDDLLTATNSVINTGSILRFTYSTQLFHMVGRQVAGMRAGCTIHAISALNFPGGRISRETLTVSRDASGNPLKGMWDVALETGYPLRGPTAYTGFGGQGSQSGALSTYTFWSQTTVFESDPGIDVGESETALAQLQDDVGGAVTVEGVSLTWSVVKDDIDTPHPDYNVLDNPTLTDKVGQSIVVIERTASTDDSKHRVKALPS